MKKTFLISLLSLLTVPMIAQDRNNETLDNAFSYESFTFGTTTLPYRRADINLTENKKPALVLYLHGGTSRGNDNETQLKEKAVGVIYQYLTSHDMAAIFLVPQCPSGGGWTNQLRKVVNDLLKSYVQAASVDANCIYVLGGSMGGTGTWCQLSYFPDFYAAALPVAGNPTGMSAANVATTPVLTVMGTSDKIMSIQDVSNFQTEVVAAGGTLRIDVEDGWTHENTCEQSYTDTRLEWLFAQVRKKGSGIKDVQNPYCNSDGVLYDLQGRPVEYPVHGVYIRDGKKIMK